MFEGLQVQKVGLYLGSLGGVGGIRERGGERDVLGGLGGGRILGGQEGGQEGGVC
jgi:hypothetical protein